MTVTIELPQAQEQAHDHDRLNHICDVCATCYALGLEPRRTLCGQSVNLASGEWELDPNINCVVCMELECKVPCRGCGCLE